jgi:hypothetical protein
MHLSYRSMSVNSAVTALYMVLRQVGKSGTGNRIGSIQPQASTRCTFAISQPLPNLPLAVTSAKLLTALSGLSDVDLFLLSPIHSQFKTSTPSVTSYTDQWRKVFSVFCSWPVFTGTYFPWCSWPVKACREMNFNLQLHFYTHRISVILGYRRIDYLEMSFREMFLF